MALKSFLFAGNKALEQCAVSDPHHILRGARGVHVGKVQAALESLDGAEIARGEWIDKTYGPTTQAAVLAYKKKRKIINRSYQTAEDSIVGKMTIASMDDELVEAEKSVDRKQQADKCTTPIGPRRGATSAFAARSRITASPTRPLSVTASPRAVGEVRGARLPTLVSGGKGREVGISNLGGINYQSIPQGQQRFILADTAGKNCILRVPSNVSVALDGKPQTPVNGQVSVPHKVGGTDLTLTGLKPGRGVVMIRTQNEAFAEDLARDVTVGVKAPKTINLTAIVVVDAKKRRSQYSDAEIKAAASTANFFFSGWANLTVNFQGPFEHIVDEDLDDEFDFRNRAIKEAGKGNQRVFSHPADGARNASNKIVYFFWKVLNRSGSDLVGATVSNRIFLQNYGKDFKKLKLVLSHELVHALGQPGHSSQGLNLMFEHIDAAGFALDHIDIDVINPDP
jgi:hypothetical protein